MTSRLTGVKRSDVSTYQVASQLGGVLDVGALRILGPDREAHPLLVPGSFVHAVVMATGIRHRRLVELRMKQERPGCALGARRGAKYPDAA